MSSAILYIAIVAIWAFVLIPRWLRRPHLLGGEYDKPHAAGYQDGAGGNADDIAYEAADSYPQPAPVPEVTRRGATRPGSRSKVLQARRRLLTMLVTLTAVAGACIYLKLASWWVCVPPAAMLGMYLLLLRAAALADAEQARWRAAEEQQVQAARQHALAVRQERTAQVIDISARFSDQIYDQYADATIRAVGD